MSRRPDTRHDAHLRALALAGKTRGEIAQILLIAPATVTSACDRLGIKLVDGRGLRKGLGTDAKRIEAISTLYKAGYTLLQIGEQFGVTRERIRQILRAQTDITAQDGGQAVRSLKRRQARASKKDQAYMAKLGCGWDEYRKIRELGRTQMASGVGRGRTPLGAYCHQKANAARRGIGWELNFWQWWSIWEASGHWGERGRGRRSFVMCRNGDVGPYALGNVFIATAAQNVSEANSRSGLPIGVQQRRGRFEARCSVNGQVKCLGRFSSAALAHAAYLAFTDAAS